jgi:hypothetical protein
MDVPSARVEEWFWGKFKLSEPTFVAGAPSSSRHPWPWRAAIGRTFVRHPWRASGFYAAAMTAYATVMTFPLLSNLTGWSVWALLAPYAGVALSALLLFRFVTGPRQARLADRQQH